MVEVEVSGFGNLKIKHLVLDFNGTIAGDGCLLEGVGKLIRQLSKKLDIYVITADTFGSAERETAGLPVKMVHIGKEDERKEKLSLIERLGAEYTAAIGNGNNDEHMLRKAALGICVIGMEGCSVKALQNADVVVHDIRHALELFLHPKRLAATLRY